MKTLKTLVLVLIVVAVFCGAMFGLNTFTAPIIAKKQAEAEKAAANAAFDALLAVMPEGAEFAADAKIYNVEDAAASQLKDVPANVVAVYQEANGLGYVINCTAVTKDYSEAPMKITLGVAADGKICGVQINEYNDTANYDFRKKDPTYLDTYLGKDSALADVGTVAGSTFSSTAFKKAVEEAMGVLIANDMIAAGKKSDDQVLTEIIPTVAPGFVKLVDATASGKITKAMKAENDAGFAYIMTDVLAVVNATGVCKIYDVTGADVTDAHSDLVAEAQAAAATEQKSYVEVMERKISNLMDGAADITPVQVDIFNTVVVAERFTVNGAVYYGFTARSVGFDGKNMDIYVIIDSNGAIAKVDAKEFIILEEHFDNFAGMDASAYKKGFIGLTAETFTGEQAVIATATMSSNAMKQAVNDAFAAFEAITKGGTQE